ncbi:MAG: hypothetical protein H3C57_02535 [Gammaproteobacteria bacterium]|nr:hypothetical protein [Gammaproteobacteria bacterium]
MKPGKHLVIRMLPLAATVLLASGCSLWRSGSDPCALASEYQQAREAPEVSVPAGMDALDSTTRLYVPAGPVPAEPLAGVAGCLQQPPPYFDKPLQETDK